jgi:hypothetical protein
VGGEIHVLTAVLEHPHLVTLLKNLKTQTEMKLIDIRKTTKIQPINSAELTKIKGGGRDTRNPPVGGGGGSALTGGV